MFENLSSKLVSIFDKLKSRGLLSEEDVNNALREIRIALLEADVALPVVKEFILRVKEKAIGQELMKSISPGHLIVKIVQDELIEILSGDSNITFSAPPSVIMMVGLQGSGKTTSAAKLALKLKQENKKKVLLTSVDIYRPGAQKQLLVNASQVAIDMVDIVENQKPIEITKRSLQEAKNGGYDVLIIDTAGRLHIDEELMDELKQIKALTNPAEILLVADAMTGQDAVNIAQNFNEALTLTGIILTRVDGDARGGAALSMRYITNCPIKFLGVGEKLNEFEKFDASRVASRILDKGDIISLVEKASAAIETEEAEKLAKKLQKGTFDLNDLLKQLRTIKKMGGIGSLVTMIPGFNKFKDQIGNMKDHEKLIKRQEAVILSMTDKERRNPKLIDASRKKRIAAGSGTQVQDVNTLLKRFADMEKMMKQFKKMEGNKGMMSKMKNLFG